MSRAGPQACWQDGCRGSIHHTISQRTAAALKSKKKSRWRKTLGLLSDKAACSTVCIHQTSGCANIILRVYAGVIMFVNGL